MSPRAKHSLSPLPLLSESPCFNDLLLSPSPRLLSLPSLPRSLPPEIIYRDLESTDAEALNDLYNETIRFDHTLDLAKERLLFEREEWVELMMRRRYPCVVATTVHGQVIGFCALQVPPLF